MYPNTKYDSEIQCHLNYEDSPEQMRFIPGDQNGVSRLQYQGHLLGTIIDVLINASVLDRKNAYLIQFNNITTMSVPLADMPSFVPSPPTSQSSQSPGLISYFAHLERCPQPCQPRHKTPPHATPPILLGEEFAQKITQPLLVANK